MKQYWIHYTAVDAGESPRFGILEADETGRQQVISPPGRIESASDAVSLLISKGADPAEAKVRVEAAMRQGIAHLLVKDEEA